LNFSHQALQKELHAVQGELSKMSHASQQLMLEASSDSKSVIKQTITDLHERLSTLEGHVEQKQEKLQQKDEQAKKYQVC
jgi:gas vesicle protein